MDVRQEGSQRKMQSFMQRDRDEEGREEIKKEGKRGDTYLRYIEPWCYSVSLQKLNGFKVFISMKNFT